MGTLTNMNTSGGVLDLRRRRFRRGDPSHRKETVCGDGRLCERCFDYWRGDLAKHHRASTRSHRLTTGSAYRKFARVIALSSSALRFVRLGRRCVMMCCFIGTWGISALMVTRRQ